jgi:hypothetical protein
VTPGERARAAGGFGWVESAEATVRATEARAAGILAQGAARIAAAEPLRQTLWIPDRLPGLNEVIAAAKGRGGRGHAYAKMKRDLGEFVWANAKAARLRPVRRARLHFLWVEKDRRRDPDNVSSAGRKFILDGLVKAGVLPGDGWAAIESWSDTFTVDAKHGVAVTILEVQ